MPDSTTPPPALRVEQTPFTRHTMAARVPGILRQVSERNPDYDPAVHAAINELALALVNDAIMPLPNHEWPDYEAWATLFEPHAGESWLHTNWFFAEVYVYHLLLHAVGYFEGKRDPFAPYKHEELQGAALPQVLKQGLALREQPARERLNGLLELALFANRMDLSLTTSAALGTHAHAGDMLADDRAAALDHLLGSEAGTIHLIADNAAAELTLDLLLIDALLETAAADVFLHLKARPMFVSDATPHDLAALLNVVFKTIPVDGAAELGSRLMMAGWQGRLKVTSFEEWNRPHFLRDLPEDALQAFASAALVITKGDLNYRRITGDALWNPATPFAEAAAYFPAPLLALRTLKSESIVGLQPGQAEKLDAEDPKWRISGRRGVIQLSKK